MPAGLFFQYVVVFALLLGVMYVVLRIGLSAMAEADLLFTFRREGQFKYVMKGKQLKKILYKLRDHYLDENFNVLLISSIVDPAERAKKLKESQYESLLEKLFGVCWIGLPPYQILRYKFVRERFERPEDRPKIEGDPHFQVVDSKHHIIRRDDDTNYLIFMYNYPLMATQLETSGQVEIDIFGIMTIKVTNAYFPVIIYEGRWYEKVKEAATGALNDLTKSMTFEGFRAADKVKILSKCVEDSSARFSQLGVKIESYTFSDWSSSNDDVEQAARAKRLAEMNGEGIIAAATAKATAIRLTGDATADAAKALVNASAGAPDITKTQLFAEAIGKHQGTLVLGGTQTPIMLSDIEPKNPTPPSPQP